MMESSGFVIAAHSHLSPPLLAKKQGRKETGAPQKHLQCCRRGGDDCRRKKNQCQRERCNVVVPLLHSRVFRTPTRVAEVDRGTGGETHNSQAAQPPFLAPTATGKTFPKMFSPIISELPNTQHNHPTFLVLETVHDLSELFFFDLQQIIPPPRGLVNR